MAGYRIGKGFVSTKMDASVLPSATAKPLGAHKLLFRSCASTSGNMVSPAAYRILYLRLTHLVQYPFHCSFSWVRPSGQIHIVFTNALNFSIESGPVVIIIFTDGEQTFKIISCLVKTEG